MARESRSEKHGCILSLNDCAILIFEDYSKENDAELNSIIGADSAHLGLHHATPLLSDTLHKLMHVDLPLLPNLHKHSVQGDKGACTPHSCTAVHQQWWTSWWMDLPHSLQEAHESDSVLGNPVVWPAYKVTVGNTQRWIIGFCFLKV